MKTKILLFLFALAALAPLKAAFVNDSAPDFTLSTLDGKQVSLKDHRGKVVFVNFWASWCPPCKKEFPELNELANEYKDQKFVLLAVNLDKSADRVRDFLAKMKVAPKSIVILLDPAAKVVADYIARSMPSSFVIDSKGIIRFVHFGYGEKDPAKWRQEIDSLLGKL